MSGPTLILMPGASLMDITTTPGGVRICCPECGEVLIIRDSDAERGDSIAIAHEDDCSLYARINDAIRHYERTTVRYG